MVVHNKRLQYTVRVAEPNPVLGSLLLEQFGGPDGELAAAMRYFTQGLSEEDAGQAVGPVDGGDGSASVGLSPEDRALIRELASRTRSDPTVDPPTGAELAGEPARV